MISWLVLLHKKKPAPKVHTVIWVVSWAVNHVRYVVILLDTPLWLAERTDFPTWSKKKKKKRKKISQYSQPGTA